MPGLNGVETTEAIRDLMSEQLISVHDPYIVAHTAIP